MSEKDERLSALLDNALDRKELNEFMQDLKRDPLDDAERTQRYQLISDVMRDELSEISFMDISAAVHRAVEQEEMVPASTARPRAKWFNLPALVKPLTGMAIAASVAMVTVVAVRTESTDSEETLPLQAVADSSKVPVTPVNPAIAQHVRAASTENNPQLRSRNSQLNEYILNHAGYAGQASVSGMMPYAPVGSFDSEAKR